MENLVFGGQFTRSKAFREPINISMFKKKAISFTLSFSIDQIIQFTFVSESERKITRNGMRKSESFAWTESEVGFKWDGLSSSAIPSILNGDFFSRLIFKQTWKKRSFEQIICLEQIDVLNNLLKWDEDPLFLWMNLSQLYRLRQPNQVNLFSRLKIAAQMLFWHT